jgi:hypothetical protein
LQGGNPVTISQISEQFQTSSPRLQDTAPPVFYEFPRIEREDLPSAASSKPDRSAGRITRSLSWLHGPF